MPDRLIPPPVIESSGSPPRVRADLCSALRYARSRCSACIDACSLGAIRRDGRSWKFASSCDRCGACAGACPTGAVNLSPSAAGIESRVRQHLAQDSDASILFACERSGSEPRESIRIPCMARLDEAMLVFPLFLGAGEVRLAMANCANCDRKERFRKVFGGVLRAAKRILKACGMDPGRIRTFRVAPLPVKSAVPVPGQDTRRAFFLRLIGAVPLSPSSSPAGALDAGRRHRLLEAVRGGGETPATGASDGFPMASVEISPACLGCNVCEHVCATGAIDRRVSTDGTVTLGFDPGLCIACRSCEEACLPRAIALSTGDFADLGSDRRHIVATLPPRQCLQCGEGFHSNSEGLCPRCRHQRDSGSSASQESGILAGRQET